MPRARDPKMKKYHEIAMAEWRKAKARKENGEMSAETFKKNLRLKVSDETHKRIREDEMALRKEQHNFRGSEVLQNLNLF